MLKSTLTARPESTIRGEVDMSYLLDIVGWRINDRRPREPVEQILEPALLGCGRRLAAPRAGWLRRGGVSVLRVKGSRRREIPLPGVLE